MTDSKISIIRIILGAAVFVIIFRLVSLDIVGVSGSSMTPTLVPGQMVVVNRLAYGFQVPVVNRYLFFWNSVREGDIIVFRSPVEDRSVVKRCIAVSGMPIEILDGILIVSGRRYPLDDTEKSCLARYREVPEMTVLAIGDNPAASIDSREYGFVPLDNIHGRVIGNGRGKRS